MEIIHNSTGGRVPKFWRPPYGDSDNRVRAIAEEVSCLLVLTWTNQELNRMTGLRNESHYLEPRVLIISPVNNEMNSV